MNNPITPKKENTQSKPLEKQNLVKNPFNKETKKTSTLSAPNTKQTMPEDVHIDTSATEAGINLIPTLTKSQVVAEERKKKLNVGSIVSLLILVVVSILIVGFNIISQIQLNNEKKVLADYENQMQEYKQKMISSNEIVDRVFLYQDIEGKTYSPKGVIEYINGITAKSGNASITKFTLGNDLSFTITGTANDLENVSKLWYLLSNDANVSTVDLKSVSSTSTRTSFTFTGTMIFDSFLSSSN